MPIIKEMKAKETEVSRKAAETGKKAGHGAKKAAPYIGMFAVAAA